MIVKQIIPKRHETFTKCIGFLLGKPDRKAFQRDLKRIVHPKSWYKVVKPEMTFWNTSLENEYGCSLVVTRTMKNPRTGRKNEMLCQIHPSIEEVRDKEKYLLLIIKRGEKYEERTQN